MKDSIIQTGPHIVGQSLVRGCCFLIAPVLRKKRIRKRREAGNFNRDKKRGRKKEQRKIKVKK